MASVSIGARKDLTDRQWRILEPLLPRGKRPGRPPKWSRRQLINGVRWRARVGAPWRDVPERYGHWQSIYGLFRCWQRTQVWPLILAKLQAFATSMLPALAAAPTRRSSHPGPSRPITRWAAPAAAGPPRFTWPASRAANRCRWC
jgi:transposase